MEEVEGIRTEFGKRLRSMDDRVRQQSAEVADGLEEVAALRRTFDTWSTKERDWSKDVRWSSVGAAALAACTHAPRGASHVASPPRVRRTRS